MHLYPMGVLSRSRPWRKPCERAWPCMHSYNQNLEFSPIKTVEGGGVEYPLWFFTLYPKNFQTSHT